MARFGQGLIQGLINPGYELNTTGMMAGGLAGSIAERKKEEAEKEQIQQTVASLMKDESPQRIRQGAAALFQKDPAAAQMLLNRAQEVSQKMAQLTGVDASAARRAQNEMKARLAQATTEARGERQTQEKEQAKKNALSSYVSAQASPKLVPLVEAGVITPSNVNQFIQSPKEVDWAAVVKSAKYTPESVQAAKNANDFSLLTTLNGSSGTLEGKNRYLSVGGQVLDMQTNTWITPPSQPGNTGLDIKDAADLYKNFTSESIQKYLKDPLNNPLVPLVNTKVPEIGEVPASVEKQFAAINEQSGSASISLTQNRNLQQVLLADPSKSTGIVSDLRTFALDVAGLRDAEEETKTTYLRNRNTEIINNLPPGVASDRDIQIFSQGFPKPNASSEEILRYLQVEEKMLAYNADMGLLADRHLQSQINPANGQSGQKATMVGFVDKRTTYAKVMIKAERLIEEARANQDLEKERQLISQLSAVLGFTPKLYE